MIVQPLVLISVLVLTFNVKSTFEPITGLVGLLVVGVAESLLPHAPRHDVITSEPALNPKAARKSLRYIIN